LEDVFTSENKVQLIYNPTPTWVEMTVLA